MAAVGIIAEYNPFHLGHQWHLAETRRRLGEDVPAVCVMSGSWVQRGECALTDKWTRAALALRGGADLVLELPLPWAISSAESFARGGAAVLEATGVVDVLSFGSERGELEPLERLAGALDSEEYRLALRQELDKGKPFAEARESAAEALLGQTAKYLEGPNDSLGVEYLRALGARSSQIRPMAVRRRGAAHNSLSPEKGFASASALRDWVERGDWDEVARWTPQGTAEALQKAGVARMTNGERAMLAKLRTMTEADFAALPDSGVKEGLPARMVKAAGEACTLEEFYALAKTRRYAHARIRRLAVWAFLEMTAQDRPACPLYLRVLGMNDRGKDLLRQMKETASLPILTKTAHIKDLAPEAQALFRLECRGTDLFGLCTDKVKPCGMDYLRGPVIL